MPIKISKAQTFEKNELYSTGFINGFYNNHKKYGESLSIKINDTDLERFIEMLEEKTECEFITKSKKDPNNKYIKMKFDKNLSFFDDDNERIESLDKETIFMNNDISIIFSVKPYNYKGEEGMTLRAHQIKVKPKVDKFKIALFD